MEWIGEWRREVEWRGGHVRRSGCGWESIGVRGNE